MFGFPSVFENFQPATMHKRMEVIVLVLVSSCERKNKAQRCGSWAIHPRIETRF
jgi:hypothetical protein